MMKDLNNYREISNKELQEIKGGFGVGVGIALFMGCWYRFIYGRLYHWKRPS